MNTRNERTDVHTPSRIIPSNYEYVAIWTMNIQGLGDAQFMLQERETVKRHMDRTNGEYAQVDTSGSCQVCGNVQAIYLALFWHKPSNTYIRLGFDCTQKLEMSGDLAAFNLFRKNIQNAREAHAGKRKAIAILADLDGLNLSEAWDIYTAEPVKHNATCAILSQTMLDDYGVKCDCGIVDNASKYEESTIRDIVGKLVQYGNISEKAGKFLASLLKRIVDRPFIEAQRQAEKDAAGPAPEGRQTVTGVVLSLKQVEGRAFSYHDDGTRTKVLIKLENGSKVYGNRFANVEKGDTVTFVASFDVSDRDPKFGFFKRASLPAPVQSKEQKKARAKLARILKTIPYTYAREEWGAEGTLAFFQSHQTLEALRQQIYEEVAQ